jgi:peptide deformylase
MSVREVVAIAANQVGEPLRLAIVEVEEGNPRYPYKPPEPLAVMINPTIEPLGEELIEINEGCLSVPDLRGSLERPLAIRIRYLDRQGIQHEEVKRGLTAGTFQHEVDHLNGVLFVDRADPRTFATWAQFDLHQRDEFLRRVARISDALES